MAPNILILLIATLVLANLVNSRVSAASTRIEVTPTISDTSQHVDSKRDSSKEYDGGENLLKQIESLVEQIENKSSVVGGSDAIITKSALEQIAKAKETIAHPINNTVSVSAEVTQNSGHINKFNNRVKRKRRPINRANEIRAIYQHALEKETEVVGEIPENIEAQHNSNSEDYEYENGDETQNEMFPAKSKSGNKNVAKGQRGRDKGKTPAHKQSKKPNRAPIKFTLNGINIPSNKIGRGANSKNKNRGRAKFGKKN